MVVVEVVLCEEEMIGSLIFCFFSNAEFILISFQSEIRLLEGRSFPNYDYDDDCQWAYLLFYHGHGLSD